MDKYVARSELRLMPYNILEQQADPKYLETLQDLTKEFIDRLCWRSFEQQGTDASPIEKRVNGTGLDTIFTPERLLTLKKIRVYSSGTNYTEYAVENFYYGLTYVSWNVYSDSIVSSRLRVEDFPLGKYNIGIVGVWGWASVPTPIKYLQGRIIQKLITDKEFASKFKNMSIGDLTSITVDTDENIFNDIELGLIVIQYRNNIKYAII